MRLSETCKYRLGYDYNTSRALRHAQLCPPPPLETAGTVGLVLPLIMIRLVISCDNFSMNKSTHCLENCSAQARLKLKGKAWA
jgi:hypothetical protein